MTTATPSPTDDLTSTLEGMRAAMAADGTRKGIKGALVAAILRLLEALVALLAEFRAGTLSAAAAGRAAPSPSPTWAASGTSAASATSAAGPARAAGETSGAGVEPAAAEVWPAADRSGHREPPRRLSAFPAERLGDGGGDRAGCARREECGKAPGPSAPDQDRGKTARKGREAIAGGEAPRGGLLSLPVWPVPLRRRREGFNLLAVSKKVGFGAARWRTHVVAIS
jgi:hypothetical protein